MVNKTILENSNESFIDSKVESKPEIVLLCKHAYTERTCVIPSFIGGSI
jgi:hypothetical protein